MPIKKRFSNGFKAKVALSALKGDKTLAELSSEFGVHSIQINRWKKKLLEQAPALFSPKDDSSKKDKEQLIENLYKHIGQLQVERDWLKKKLDF